MQRIILISILVCLTYFTTPTSSASKYYDGESRPYEFGFKIEKNQHRYEKRDENGIVMGQFGFVTADGIYHVTVYATDENGSFKIVSMRNVKVAEIDDVFNIGPGAPTPKFEIVPLRATTPSSYSAVTPPPKLNAPFVQPKQVTEKSCSNCIRPTTQPPIPITFAPVQHNTQKPFGIGLPEKLTTYQQYDATPKPVVTAINRIDLPNGDEYTQIRTPEDQTQPIRKGSVVPTVSDTLFQSFQPEQPQNVQFTPGKLVSTVKDSIQKVSLQQAPVRVEVTQNAEQFNPRPGAIFQTQPPVTPVPGLTIQPPLLNNELGEQPQVYINPSTPTEFQFNEPTAPVRELNINPQIQSVPNEPIEQPVYTQISNVPQTQPGPNPVQDDTQFFQPEIPQNIPVEQPVEYNKFTTPSQDYFENPASPIIDPVSLVHEDLNSPIQQQPPSYVESVEPALPVQGFVQNIQPQVQQGPVNQISPIVTDTYSNIPTIELGNDIENDYGKVLVVEPLSPDPQVRINLPKPINAPPGQIPNLPAPVLNDLKERMLELRNKPTPPSGAAPPEPIRQFQNKFNVPDMEHILGDILYRFNYTAGYHGHHEQGDRDGNKEGGYYLVSRDGYRRIVEYTANEDGYRPRIHLEYAQPQDVPQPETEKEKGLGGSEFKWFYVI